MRIISRGISNLEDIEVLMKEEVEKAVRAKGATRSLIGGLFVTVYEFIDTADRYHSGL